MNRCLKDKALFLLHDGEGTSAQQTHLKECEACAARYQQLRRDLETISQVLREEPPEDLPQDHHQEADQAQGDERLGQREGVPEPVRRPRSRERRVSRGGGGDRLGPP